MSRRLGVYHIPREVNCYIIKVVVSRLPLGLAVDSSGPLLNLCVQALPGQVIPFLQPRLSGDGLPRVGVL